MKKDWIKDATKNKGALHKALGVPADKKIPEKKLDKALHSKNTKIRKEAILDRTLKSFHRKGK
jgi:hypothetical protein